MKAVNAKEGCSSVGAESLAIAMGLTSRPDNKPVATSQADHWARWLKPNTPADDVDIDLGTEHHVTVLLAALGRVQARRQNGWQQRRVSFLERRVPQAAMQRTPDVPLANVCASSTKGGESSTKGGASSTKGGTSTLPSRARENDRTGRFGKRSSHVI